MRRFVRGLVAGAALLAVAEPVRGDSTEVLRFLRMAELQAKVLVEEPAEEARRMQTIPTALVDPSTLAAAAQSADSLLSSSSLSSGAGSLLSSVGGVTTTSNPGAPSSNGLGNGVVTGPSASVMDQAAALGFPTTSLSPDSISSGITTGLQTVGQLAGVTSTAPAPTPDPWANLPPSATPLTRNCGNPMAITVKSLAEYRVYVDGVQVGYSNGVQTQTFRAGYNSSGLVTVAVEAVRDRDLPNFERVDGLWVNVTACGQTFTSDQGWTCSDVRPWTNNWRLTEYQAADWTQARMVREDVAQVDGSKSFSIWSKQCSSTALKASDTPEAAYCRLEFRPANCPNQPCYREQRLDLPGDSCLSSCSTDSCSGIARTLSTSTCAATCSASTMARVRNYCRNIGCSARDCGATADPAPIPSLTCLAPCTAGMAQRKDVCQQQAFQFQSGCSAGCGPEALAYARDVCTQQLGCAPAQCSVFNSSTPVVSGGGGGGSNTPAGTPKPTPPPTPDLSCFIRCLSGMNRYTSYCDKINFALTSGCHNCPQSVITWAKESCLSYVDEATGVQCTPQQCAAAR